MSKILYTICETKTFRQKMAALTLIHTGYVIYGEQTLNRSRVKISPVDFDKTLLKDYQFYLNSFVDENATAVSLQISLLFESKKYQKRIEIPYSSISLKLTKKLN